MPRRKAAEPEAPDVVVLYTTIANNDQARELATNLLAEGLVACANIFPIWSLYHWKGTLQDESEVAMLLKTHTDRVAELMRRVPELHPYETPCLEAFPMEGVHPPFAAWVRAEATGVPKASAPAATGNAR